MPAVKRYLLDHESNDGVKCTREKQARTHRPFSSLIVLNIPITSLNIDSPKKDNQRKKEVKTMPGACGIACEVCGLKEKGDCPGCAPGTDEKARAMVEWLKGVGISCPVLECAIKNKVDYCLRCESLPCDVLYQAEFPYSKKLLDIFKEIPKE